MIRRNYLHYIPLAWAGVLAMLYLWGPAGL